MQMAIENIKQQMTDIEGVLEQSPEGLSRSQIAGKLDFYINNKTLQRRLSSLLRAGRIVKSGNKKAAKYYPVTLQHKFKGRNDQNKDNIFSQESKNALDFLQSSIHYRTIVSYKKSYIEQYVPNETDYVSKELREVLFREGKRYNSALAAGTYARQICQRLLIDLSYNSSRLEGNTYSMLDTQKLVEEGISAEGKVQAETVMIMNHKEAILFLVENAPEIELNNFTLFNLHYLLSQDLLANHDACGNIRSREVVIGESTYKPLSNPHALREQLELILLKARKIENPFEQSFFLLVHLSYLQAFEDVNKRTSRLACNIPFIKQNLCPLSFTDVTHDDYTAAMLAIYEKNEARPLLDLFCWAYIRSCEQYGIVKQSLGEIDVFRIHYRQQRKEAMGLIIRDGLHDEAAEKGIVQFCAEKNIKEVDKFVAMTLADLSRLHAGAIIGLGISQAQFLAWSNLELG